MPAQQRDLLKQFRATHPFQHIVAKGVEWEYLVSGTGKETILLLVGGLRYAEFWYEHVLALESTYQVIAPSYGPASTMKGTLDAIIAILDAEQIDKVHAVGQSLGGLVAQCLVREHPERVATMILSNTTAPADFLDPQLREATIKRLQKGLRRYRLIPYWLLRPLIVRRVTKLFSGDPTKKEFWKAYLHELFTFHTTKTDLLNIFHIMLDLAENWSFSVDDLHHWQGRILLIGSDYDPAFDPIEWEAVKRLYPHAEVYTFQGTGHTAAMVKRNEYLAQLMAFLQR